jgi:hypothetical protein
MTAIDLPKTIENPLQLEWRLIKTEGTFSPDKQILLRNRYFEGQYGYEVLTLFTNMQGMKFWVDRGWVKAGADATTAPITPPIPTEQVRIVGRFRLGTSLPSGTFVALPGGGKSGITSEVNAQSRENTEDFYLDLVSGSTPNLTPQVSAKVLGSDGVKDFVHGYVQLVNSMMDGYMREGKKYVTIAVGCTGGKHRSVAITEEIARQLSAVGAEISAHPTHRDVGRE